jgi:hypothetical protein
MKKLIELLNEYIPKWWSIEHWGKSVFYEWLNYNDRIIWKDFWFIKWLVENDKIDKKKIDTRLVRNVESHYDEDWYWVENSYEDYSDYKCLLMLLSISDTPIEDLISYLK